MDETKNLSTTEDSQSLNRRGENCDDATMALSATEGCGPTVQAAGVLTPGDPKKIGRYTSLGRLVQGGFGRVYLAHDNDLDRSVAIKVPNPERITRPEDVQTFLAEARILAKLDHPNIVPVHDVGRTAVFYELLPGRRAFRDDSLARLVWRDVDNERGLRRSPAVLSSEPKVEWV